jgi:hypothetical protein
MHPVKKTSRRRNKTANIGRKIEYGLYKTVFRFWVQRTGPPKDALRARRQVSLHLPGLGGVMSAVTWRLFFNGPGFALRHYAVCGHEK